MIKFSPNATGLLELFKLLQRNHTKINCYLPDTIHTISAGDYSIDSVEEIFPHDLFEEINNKRLIYFNLINAQTGKITGLMCTPVAENESISECLFSFMENFQMEHNFPFSGAIIRYNNGESPKTLKYIPFAVIE